MKRFCRMLLFFCDSGLLFAAALGCFYLIQGIGLPDAAEAERFFIHTGVLLLCVTAAQLLFGAYKRNWCSAESGDFLLLLFTALCGVGLYIFLCQEVLQDTPLFVLVLAPMVSVWVLGMLTVRLVLGSRPAPVEIAIVGIGSTGGQLLRELKKATDRRYWVRCCFDADSKDRRRIRGVPVKRTLKDVPTRLMKKEIRDVIVNLPALAAKDRRSLLRELMEQSGVRVLVLPTAFDASLPLSTQLRSPQLEDLLGRDPAQLDDAAIDAALTGRVVMVTGGGGSVGSELCRQIAKHRPAKLVVVDNYENNAYALQHELRDIYGDALDLCIEIASVREEARVRQLFAHYRPQVVFHAAAHKHVPLMETNPQEAVRNNVFGTWNLVCAAEEFRVEKFVLISTDKAVDPTSVMGASKRLCEMILQSRGGQGSPTTFAAVRFGNVLESNGSVVPVFRRQIAAGGPVTLMDKRMTRYFMTISEAARLVLTAGAMARQSELYVLNMGQPVKITELAEDLIRLSGLRPYQDIDMIEIGLRPGDKMHEKLFLSGSRVERTENDQIFIERQPGITSKEMRDKLTILTVALTANDPVILRKALHDAVPTYYEPSVTTERERKHP